ncbi:MAG: DUF547 domain-containing protein [Bdellovibrionales bacterium]
MGSGTETEPPSPPVTQFRHDHAQWDKFLKKYVTVNNGVSLVDYEAIKKNRRELDSYTESLQTIAGTEFSGLSENERLAFLINAYNALTIQLIIDNYPGIKSIKDIRPSFSLSNPTRSPWKIKFFKLFMEEHSLDDIEHEMIRKKFKEPRIHFAVVCASKGCPPLRFEAYLADKLDMQLTEATKAFLKNGVYNRFDANENTLYLSSIFKWYGDDFVRTHGSVKSFVAPYIAKTPDESRLIQNDKVKIKFLDYDWSLNSK